jgi:hypothetical protein
MRRPQRHAHFLAPSSVPVRGQSTAYCTADAPRPPRRSPDTFHYRLSAISCGNVRVSCGGRGHARLRRRVRTSCNNQTGSRKGAEDAKNAKLFPLCGPSWLRVSDLGSPMDSVRVWGPGQRSGSLREKVVMSPAGRNERTLKRNDKDPSPRPSRDSG